MQSIGLTLGATSTGAREEQVNIAYYRGVYKVACSRIGGYGPGFADAGGREEEPEKVSRIIRVHLFTNTVVRMLAASQLSSAGRTSRKKHTFEVPGRGRPA